MAIFERMRRSRRSSTSGRVAQHEPVPLDRLPAINQRVSVAMGEHVPVPSRIEDAQVDGLLLAAPALALEPGDEVLISWECDGSWCMFTTRVIDLDRGASVPTITLSTAGRLTTHDERRLDARRAVELPVDLRVVRSRAIRPGRELQVRTTEISGSAIRFASSAPFAPGDVVEARIEIGAGVEDLVGARVRVIRVDSVSGTWRATVTASYEEILRSDRARLLATAAATAPEPIDEQFELAPPERVVSSAPTADGVGGRDEPESISSLDAAVEWLKRRS